VHDFDVAIHSAKLRPCAILWDTRLPARPDKVMSFCTGYALPGSRVGKPLPLVKLVDNFDASYSYVANEGTVFTFLTNLNASLYR